jgi:hypothetical protein
MTGPAAGRPPGRPHPGPMTGPTQTRMTCPTSTREDL